MHGGLVPHRCSEQHPGDERRHVSRAVGPRHDRLSIHPGMLVASPRAAVHLFPREIPLHRGDLRFGRRFFVGALIDLDVPPPPFCSTFSASMLGYRCPPASNERGTGTMCSRREYIIVPLCPVSCFDSATSLATLRVISSYDPAMPAPHRVAGFSGRGTKGSSAARLRGAAFRVCTTCHIRYKERCYPLCRLQP